MRSISYADFTSTQNLAFLVRIGCPKSCTTVVVARNELDSDWSHNAAALTLYHLLVRRHPPDLNIDSP